MKPRERIQARKLRSDFALPMKEIAARVGVSISSVSRWTGDIVLTAEQLAARAECDPRVLNRVAGTARRAESARALRRQAQDHGRRMARNGDLLHCAGCMLYWGEGSKARNTVTFTNCDADMLKMFLRFLVTCYCVDPSDVTLAVNCHLTNGLTLEDIEEWWLDQLALPRSSLRTASVNSASAVTKRRRNTLRYGTVQLRVYSTFIVQSIYGAIQEYAGADRPEWLDCRPLQIDRSTPPSTASH